MSILKSKKFTFLGLFVFLSFFMSWWGGYISNYYKEPWYSELIKPSFNPPDLIFAPVWIILYLSMGFAIWLIWLNPKKTQKIFNIYFIHLIINASWSITFFAFHQILVSLIIIGLIIFFVASMPLIFGILMSIKITSGFSETAQEIASKPSLHSPTTSIPSA